MIDGELRKMLESKAAEFRSAPLDPECVLRRARVRRARSIGALTLVAVGLGAASAVMLGMSPDQRAFAAFALIDKKGAAADRSEGSAPARGNTAKPLTLAQLTRHVKCMRAHGVNVPDPRATPEGWTIPVKEPPFRDEKAFRGALFVDCRLENVTENLVLGGRSQAYIDRLMACTRSRGFVLPPPTKDSSGQFQFDVNKARPAWGSDAWYRIVFVRCAGPLPAP